MTADTLPATEDATRTEPPKAWRNRWRARMFAEEYCARCGRRCLRQQGEAYWAHCSTWPTEREAIEAAANIMLVDTLTDGHEPGEYLGAFPIPVSP